MELSNGNAEIRDVSEVTVRMAQPVQSAYQKAVVIGSQEQTLNPELIGAINVAIVLCMVKSWSYGEVTEDVLMDIQKDDFNKLANACFEEYNRTGEFGPTTDPKAPTGDSPA